MYSINLFIREIILSARKVILDLIILTLLVVFLLTILISRLPNKLPLGALIKLRLLKASVGFQNLDFVSVGLRI